MAAERKVVKIIPAEIPRREELEQRLKTVGNNIHTPHCWYREDVQRLLAYCDGLHTRIVNQNSENNNEGV